MSIPVVALALTMIAGCAFVPPRVPVESGTAQRDVPVDEAPPASRTPAPDEDRILITVGREDFVFEIADDDAERAKGLSGREEIPKHGGMIFVYPMPAQRSFWMLDCLVPIDIAYLDADGRIVAMYEMPVDPPRGEDESVWDYEYRLKRYPSRKPAQFALEFRAGTLRRLNLSIGEQIDFDRGLLSKRARRNSLDVDW